MTDTIKVKPSKITSKLKKMDNQISTPNDDVLPKRTGILWLIVGRKGSGKSTVLLNALKAKQEDGGYRSIFSSYKQNAKARKLNFNVDFDYAINIMKSNCHYCGIEPSNTYMKSYYNVKYNGIDRVDNSRGYENENVVSCCKMCNIAKNNNSEEDFLKWVKRLSEYQKLKQKAALIELTNMNKYKG